MRHSYLLKQNTPIEQCQGTNFDQHKNFRGKKDIQQCLVQHLLTHWNDIPAEERSGLTKASEESDETNSRNHTDPLKETGYNLPGCFSFILFTKTHNPSLICTKFPLRDRANPLYHSSSGT